MQEFTEITLDHKVLFDKYLKSFNPQVSELTFTNLFMWRGYYKFRFAEIDGLLCIVSAPLESEPFAFMPVGRLDTRSFTNAVSCLEEYFAGQGWRLRFKRIPEDLLVYFEGLVKSAEDIAFDRDNSDYVYLAEDFIQLKGKRYDGKRNHINKFKSLYSYEYVVLEEGLIEECARIMDEWCAQRSCDQHKGLYCEKAANMELLHNYRALGCKGAMIKVGSRFEAFTVGEMLNSDTAVIHIEKAGGGVQGLYTFINQQFCEHEWKDAVYINREQDLGMEGLRKAKLSYSPVKMINKYTVSL